MKLEIGRVCRTIDTPDVTYVYHGQFGGRAKLLPPGVDHTPGNNRTRWYIVDIDKVFAMEQDNCAPSVPKSAAPCVPMPKAPGVVTNPDLDVAAVKHDTGKNMLELLPFESLQAVGEVLTFGAKKYAAHNWRKGFMWSRLLGAGLRHVFAWARGQDNDPETGKSHIAHAACCLLFLLSHIILKQGTDDRAKTE